MKISTDRLAPLSENDRIYMDAYKEAYLAFLKDALQKDITLHEINTDRADQFATEYADTILRVYEALSD
jgi:hypothetical protein